MLTEVDAAREQCLVLRVRTESYLLFQSKLTPRTYAKYLTQITIDVVDDDDDAATVMQSAAAARRSIVRNSSMSSTTQMLDVYYGTDIRYSTLRPSR